MREGDNAGSVSLKLRVWGPQKLQAVIFLLPYLGFRAHMMDCKMGLLECVQLKQGVWWVQLLRRYRILSFCKV